MMGGGGDRGARAAPPSLASQTLFVRPETKKNPQRPLSPTRHHFFSPSINSHLLLFLKSPPKGIRPGGNLC